MVATILHLENFVEYFLTYKPDLKIKNDFGENIQDLLFIQCKNKKIRKILNR